MIGMDRSLAILFPGIPKLIYDFCSAFRTSLTSVGLIVYASLSSARIGFFSFSCYLPFPLESASVLWRSDDSSEH